MRKVILLAIVSLLSSCQIWHTISGQKRKETEARQQFENTLYEQKRVLESNLKTLDRLQQDIENRLAKNPNSTVKSVSTDVQEVRREINESIQELESLEEQGKLSIDMMLAKNKRMNKKVQEYTQKVLAMNRTLELGNKENILRSDLSFETASSTLKVSGKKELDLLVSDIYQKINEWNQYENGLYRYKTKKIQVNVIGYADKQGSGDVFSRMKMNQELSEARAKSVTLYLSSKLSNNSYMQCEFNPIGLGEALPPDVLEADVADNPRRRLCLISVMVFPEM